MRNAALISPNNLAVFGSIAIAIDKVSKEQDYNNTLKYHYFKIAYARDDKSHYVLYFRCPVKRGHRLNYEQ
jgi:hypothetical protein